jgi:hypothetical protein
MLSPVVADGLMSGVVETVPEPCVMVVPGDRAVASVELSLPIVDDALPDIAPELSAAPLPLGMLLAEPPAPMSEFCASAAVPRSAAAAIMESLSMALTSS